MEEEVAQVRERVVAVRVAAVKAAARAKEAKMAAGMVVG